MSFISVYITFPNKENAELITNKLINEKLIACSNLMPISSCYFWEGEIVSESEYLGFMKTKTGLWSELIEFVEKHHPYEVPCIIRNEVRANKAYENWIEEVTKLTG